MARAVETLREVGMEAERLQVIHDREQKLKELRGERVEARLNAFDSEVRDALGGMNGSALEMRAIVDTMAATAAETLEQSDAVSQMTQTTSQNVSIVAGASEELMASICEISRQVDHSTAIVGEAIANASRATEVAGGLAIEVTRAVNETVQGMSEAAKMSEGASNQVRSATVQMSDRVASLQTNISTFLSEVAAL